MTVSTFYLLFLAIIFCIIIYQFWRLSVDSPPLDLQPLSHDYTSSISLTQKTRSWSAAKVSTTKTSTTSRLSPKTSVRRNSARTGLINISKSDSSHLCEVPKGLGPISVNTSDIPLVDVEKKFPQVKRGGRYSPPDCTARHRVAIIVPFRDRAKNLATFLNHMHPFLMKQKLEYGIFVVEQKGTHEFNRGKLMNVGFTEVPHWQCYIFHDIDLLPLDERNIYSCPELKYPRLLDAMAGLDEDALSVATRGNFGGVSALTEEQFSNINGYSNGYWGWGGEDNDLFFRLSHSGYTITQYNLSIARYASLKHQQKSRNPRRYRLLLQTMKPYQLDGLSTLHYQLVNTTRHRLYTRILVNIDHTFHELQELFKEQENFENLPSISEASSLKLG